MKNKLLLITALMLVFGPAFAGSTFNKGIPFGYYEVKLNSCGYFSSVEADFELSYQNYDLPWGTQVFLLVGEEYSEVSGPQQSYDWHNRKEVEMAATEEYVWSANFSKNLYSRSSSVKMSGLNVVFKVVYPDGKEFFDNGLESAWGFYSSDLNSSNQHLDPCHDVTRVEKLNFSIINRY